MADQPYNQAPNLRELSEKGERIYGAIPANDIAAHEGQYVAIELDSGEHFFGETKEAAVESSRSNYPNKLVFIRRVGNIEKVSSLRSRTFIGGKNKPYARLF